MCGQVCLERAVFFVVMIRAQRESHPNKELAIRARLAIAHNTALNTETVLTMRDEEFNFRLFLSNGVKATNLLVAGLGPAALSQRGVETAMQLRQLGFDALQLCDPNVCNEASTIFGSLELKDAFMQTAADAVAIAGSESQHILDVSVTELLAMCAGYPGEACAVLQQVPSGVSLRGVPARVLLDAGLRADTLKMLGYGFAAVVDQTAPTGTELHKLGYRM